MEEKVKVYSMPGCPMCRMVKLMLDKEKIPYTDCQDQEKAKELGITKFPQVLYEGTLYGAKDFIDKIKKGEIK